MLDDKGNPVGAGVSVQLNINGVFYTRTSDENGYVKLNINLPPGTYIVTAENKGLRASNTINVLTVLETQDLVMRYHDGSQFKAKVLDGQGRPYAGQTVTYRYLQNYLESLKIKKNNYHYSNSHLTSGKLSVGL